MLLKRVANWASCLAPKIKRIRVNDKKGTTEGSCHKGNSWTKYTLTALSACRAFLLLFVAQKVRQRESTKKEMLSGHRGIKWENYLVHLIKSKCTLMISAENTMISNLQAMPQALTQAKVILPPCSTVKEHNLPPFDFWKQRSTVWALVRCSLRE